MDIIAVLQRWRQKDKKFKIILGNRENLSYKRPYLKIKQPMGK